MMNRISVISLAFLLLVFVAFQFVPPPSPSPKKQGRGAASGESVASPVRQSESSVVRIEADGGFGTGFVCEVEGLERILTNGHVVPESSVSVKVCFGFGSDREVVVPAEVVKRDVDGAFDICVLKVSHIPDWAVPLKTGSVQLRDSRSSSTSGYPKGAWLSSIPIRLHDIDWGATGVIVFSPPPVRGQSGSPIVDSHNNVHSVVTFRYDGSETLGGATPIQNWFNPKTVSTENELPEGWKRIGVNTQEGK